MEKLPYADLENQLNIHVKGKFIFQFNNFLTL